MCEGNEELGVREEREKGRKGERKTTKMTKITQTFVYIRKKSYLCAKIALQ